jgi:hypothetical protein
MEQLFTKAITDKLPTLDHYKQLCQKLGNYPYRYDILDINTISTIADMQTYMYNILILKGDNINIILSQQVKYIETFKFYILPNTYTNKLTLKQFFHCIDIKYYSNVGHTIDTCTYKYNIFYKGEKFDNVYDHRNDSIIIEKRLISCYRIGLTVGTNDNNFKNLPIEHFTTLLKIMGKEYACCVASYENDYIYKYWEDKDIEVFLDYIMKGKRYYYVDDCNNYIKCILEKNIIKNNYSQEKLLPLYEKYSEYINSTPIQSPLAICYTSIVGILKRYIKFSTPTVRLGFDTKGIQASTPTIIPDAESETEIIDKIVCIVPHKIQQNLIRSYTISDFIILESGKIIFRVKNREEPFVNEKYVESISYKYTVYECDPNLFNKQVCINMFSNRYTGKDITIGGVKGLALNIGEGLKGLAPNIEEGLKGLAPNMVLYYDKELRPYIKIDFNVESYNKILPNKSNADFMTTFINAEYNKTHIYRLYIMSKTITKFLALKHKNAELQEANATLQEANAALKERTKILDESNF